MSDLFGATAVSKLETFTTNAPCRVYYDINTLKLAHDAAIAANEVLKRADDALYRAGVDNSDVVIRELLIARKACRDFLR